MAESRVMSEVDVGKAVPRCHSTKQACLDVGWKRDVRERTEDRGSAPGG